MSEITGEGRGIFFNDLGMTAAPNLIPFRYVYDVAYGNKKNGSRIVPRDKKNYPCTRYISAFPRPHPSMPYKSKTFGTLLYCCIQCIIRNIHCISISVFYLQSSLSTKTSLPTSTTNTPIIFFRHAFIYWKSTTNKKLKTPTRKHANPVCLGG